MKRAGFVCVGVFMAMCLAISASAAEKVTVYTSLETCLLYTSPSPRDS